MLFGEASRDFGVGLSGPPSPASRRLHFFDSFSAFSPALLAFGVWQDWLDSSMANHKTVRTTQDLVHWLRAFEEGGFAVETEVAGNSDKNPGVSIQRALTDLPGRGGR